MDLAHQTFYYAPPDRNWYMKYPVETLTEGSGLCAHLSALVVSLLKAEGLDAILIVYYNPDPKQAGHMNVGINLQNPPYPEAKYLVHNGKRYYISETTDYLFTEEKCFNWIDSWKVGQMPDMVKTWDYRIIGV